MHRLFGTGSHVIDVLVASFSLADGGTGTLSIGEPIQVQRLQDPTNTNLIPLAEVRELLERQ